MKKSKICILCVLALLILGLLATAIVLLAGGSEQPEETTAATQPTEMTETTAPAPEDPILTQRREVALEEMRKTMSMPIVYDADISYPIAGGSRQLQLKAGEIYYGLPYTNGSGSAAGMLRDAQPDENGVYHVSGFNGYLMGNDCADGIFWAWAKISNTITFRDTQNMTEENGCLKVGSYENPDAIHERTKQICKDNGEQTMFAAYALTRPADAMVQRNDGAGHAIMVAETVTVYAADGTIDGNESYILYHEQSMPCAVDQKFTFKMLYLTGYLPVTIRELVDANEPVEALEVSDSLEAPDMETMFTGTIRSNYRISDVTVEICDETGETLQSARRYVNEEEMYAFSMEHFLFSTHLWNYNFTEDMYRDFIDLGTLEPGSYQCRVTALMSTGETVTVRHFPFVKEASQ